MGAIDAIAASSTTEVNIGPMRFRIRRVNTALLLRAGRSGLAMIPHSPEALEALAEIVQASAESRAPTADVGRKFAEAVAKQAEEAKTRTAEQIEADVADRAAVVAAGVLACAIANAEDPADPEKWTPIEGEPEWEDVRVVINGVPPNRAAGEIHIDQLPNGTADALYDAILRHTNDGMGAAKRIATFRG